MSTAEQISEECQAFAEREGRRVMDAVAKKGGSGVVAALYAAFRAQRVAELTAQKLGERIAEIEAKGLVSYEGVFDLAKTYDKGAMVSWGGSMWCCRDNGVCGLTPGKASEKVWLKAVARGGDGASAYSSAVKHGFIGSEADWVQALQRGAA